MNFKNILKANEEIIRLQSVIDSQSLVNKESLVKTETKETNELSIFDKFLSIKSNKERDLFYKANRQAILDFINKQIK